jgi:hypothetical protein
MITRCAGYGSGYGKETLTPQKQCKKVASAIGELPGGCDRLALNLDGTLPPFFSTSQ